MPKRALRQQMLSCRRSISRQQWLENSRMAQEALMGLAEYRQAGCVALYAAAHNEIDTMAIAGHALSNGKRLLFPLVCGGSMVFREVRDLADLKPGSFGIPEPVSQGDDHLADAADLIVVPGVAFDLHGHRIGYGRGYYDRSLHSPGLKACLVGFCFDFQVAAESIPADSHDIRMNLLVTESRVIRF